MPVSSPLPVKLEITQAPPVMQPQQPCEKPTPPLSPPMALTRPGFSSPTVSSIRIARIWPQK